MKKILTGLTVFTALLLCAGKIEFFPTFNSCAVNVPAEKRQNCKVFYREKNSSTWLESFETTYDGNYYEKYRTSLIDLKENSEYEVKAEISSRRATQTLKGTFRTWSEKVPVAKTIVLTQAQVKNGFVISAKGKPNGWIRYTAAPGTVLRAGFNRPLLHLKGAEYVIVENMTLRGGSYGVLMENCKYVRLKNLDISAWGGNPADWKIDRKTGRSINSKGRQLPGFSGICLTRGFGQVIERCYIHNPGTSSHEWRYGHPGGPDAIAAFKPESTVIRYNDICGNDKKWFDDGVAGNNNFDQDGGLNKNCDFHGNFVAFANDDAIELDGGQQNVRCFRNHFENSFVGISIQGCITGPSFVFENRLVDMGSEFGQTISAFKTADTWANIYAASFIYNNVFADTPCTLGLCSVFRIVAKNNIFEGYKIPSKGSALLTLLRTEVANNLLTASGRDKKNFTGDPLFTDSARGIYTLKKNSPARKKGVKIPGLNRPNPDLGIPAGMELPCRPFPLSLTAGRKVNFTVAKGRASAPQTITAKASAPVTVKVVKSEDSDWYTVTPAAASFKKGEPVKFTVKVIPSKMKDRIHYRNTFFLRTADGWSRPVSVRAKTDFVYPETFAGNPDIFEYTFGAPFPKRPEGGVRLRDNNKDTVKIEFELKEDGMTGIYALAKDALGKNYGSVSLGIDTDDLTICQFPDSYWRPWRTKLTGERYNLMRMRMVYLKKGKHYLMIQPRKTIDLKKLYITQDVTLTEQR